MKAPSPCAVTVALVAALLAASGICVALRHSADERRALAIQAPPHSAPGDPNGGEERYLDAPGKGRIRIGDRDAFHRKLMTLLSGGDQMARNQSLLELIDGLNPADFPVLLEEMKKVCGHSDPMLLLAFSAWAEVDPSAALRQEVKDVLFGSSVALRVWVERDPMAALTWLTENGESAQLVCQALGIFAADDPAGALAWAKDHGTSASDSGAAHDRLASVMKAMLPRHFKELMEAFPQLPEETRRSLLDSVSSYIGKLPAEKRRQWLDSLPAGGSRDEAVAVMISRMSSLDDRLKLLADYPEAMDKWGASVIYTQWVKEDRQAALASLQKLPEGASRNAAVASAAEGLIEQYDRQAALDLMNRNPEAVTSDLMLNWMMYSANNQEERELTFSVLQRVGNQVSQERFYSQFFDSWLRHDHPAARAWLDSHTAELPEATTAAFEQR